jgi:alpha/beta superfamily hydrolase
MNKFYTISFLLAMLFCSSTTHVIAQYDCNNNRFLEEVFPAVTASSDLQYGSAITYSGTTENLTLDVYEPEGDVFTERPLIVFAHGGSFIGGNKTSSDIVTLCNKYSRLGYVCASINYRLGFEGFIPNATTATETVYRATTDMRAAIRYFRKDRATSNTFRIDTANIFAAGVSAGAFMALHLAYLDEISEIPSVVDPVAFGGIEGLSGNDGYSSKVKAVVNLCGAIKDTSWINAGDIPCISMHGTNDDVVPYGSSVINVIGIPIFVVDGSSSVAARQENVGVVNEFYTWQGLGHVPFVNSAVYMDSVFLAVTPFLANQLGCEVQLGISDISNPSFSVAPNPTNGIINLSSSSSIDFIKIIDMQGKVLLSESPKTISANISADFLPSGMYFIQVFSGNSWQSKRIIKN